MLSSHRFQIDSTCTAPYTTAWWDVYRRRKLFYQKVKDWYRKILLRAALRLWRVYRRTPPPTPEMAPDLPSELSLMPWHEPQAEPEKKQKAVVEAAPHVAARRVYEEKEMKKCPTPRLLYTPREKKAGGRGGGVLLACCPGWLIIE